MNSPCGTVDSSNELDSSEHYDNNEHLAVSKHSPCQSSLENSSANGNPSIKVTSPLLLSESEKSGYVMDDCLDDSDIWGDILPIFIVGRRYGSRLERDPEAKICLFRDPENVKDVNATKVLYADCEYDNLLGHVPRELAQYLSPLMDKFNLNFEGTITFVPKDLHAAVPIEIYAKLSSYVDQEYIDNIQEFKSLWRQALRGAELAKANTSRMTRYQHNLAMLLQEVLKNNEHLFTISQRSFLEAFNSLPDDSQRLFARLYTRKGFMLSTSFLSTECIS